MTLPPEGRRKSIMNTATSPSRTLSSAGTRPRRRGKKGRSHCHAKSRKAEPEKHPAPQRTERGGHQRLPPLGALAWKAAGNASVQRSVWSWALIEFRGSTRCHTFAERAALNLTAEPACALPDKTRSPRLLWLPMNSAAIPMIPAESMILWKGRGEDGQCVLQPAF